MRILPPFVRRWCGFTLIELLTVMAIIAILAALILSVASYANKKAATSRASAEIQSFSVAAENYKADNGTYPHQPLAVGGSIPQTGSIPSDQIDPRKHGYTANTALYKNSSLELYQALTGDLTNSGAAVTSGTSHNYLPDLKPDMIGRDNPSAAVSVGNPVTYLSDPFGNSYGYSTWNSTAVTSGSTANLPGYNPTFDLWSTAGTTTDPATTPGSTGDVALQWIKNW